MPTYEYQCPRCGPIEISHSIVEPARSACARCNAAITRMISGGSGVLFDTNGFWQIGRDGRETKVSRASREREWSTAARRNQPIA